MRAIYDWKAPNCVWDGCGRTLGTTAIMTHSDSIMHAAEMNSVGYMSGMLGDLLYVTFF
jgi:hypothetical protein